MVTKLQIMVTKLQIWYTMFFHSGIQEVSHYVLFVTYQWRDEYCWKWTEEYQIYIVTLATILNFLPSRSGRVVYSAVLATCDTDCRGFDPRPKPPPIADTSVSKWIEKVQLPCWPLYSQQVSHQRWIWGSPEVQKRRISGPTKRTDVLQKCF